MNKPQIHISIEGFDGVGKTTTCQKLSQRLNFLFIEKPLKEFFESESAYLKLRDQVNSWPERNFTATFYGMGSIYMYHKYADKKIITDRHLCSNYAWSGTEDNTDIYELLLSKLGKPAITAVLYAEKETIKSRLQTRNTSDSDLIKIDKSEYIYNKMRLFCTNNQLNTVWIHTDNRTPDDIANIIIQHLEETQIIPKALFNEL